MQPLLQMTDCQRRRSEFPLPRSTVPLQMHLQLSRRLKQPYCWPVRLWRPLRRWVSRPPAYAQSKRLMKTMMMAMLMTMMMMTSVDAWLPLLHELQLQLQLLLQLQSPGE